jgi:hypothetical protein
MSTSHCILLDHAHIGDQHIHSFVDSIHLLLHDYEHVTLHTPRSCPHWRSTHPFLCRFNWLVLHDHEHVMLHTPRSCQHCRSSHPFLHQFDSLSTTWSWAHHVAYSRSCPHWRSTHCFLRQFDSLSPTWSWARHIAYSSIMPTLEINTSSSFVDSIHLVLQDYEHVTLYTSRSCPHWRSTHPFLCRFYSLSTTWSWARHVAYSSIIPTLEINTSLPSLVRFA